MFSDRFFLTYEVLEGRKTQTRRICNNQSISFSTLINANKNGYFDCEKPRYDIGDIVAVAQSYKDANVAFVQLSDEAISGIKTNAEWGNPKKMAGWNNKMFVRAELMPHQIKITNVRIERLQDISDEDCLKEGIEKEERTDGKYFYKFFDARREVFVRLRTPREAFAVLTDKVNGMGTWWRNPYVFVYEFELVK